MRLERYLQATPGEIERRLRRVELAWRFERLIEANALPVALGGAVLGLLDRRFLALPALFAGWRLLRRLRPSGTLAQEREVLRLLYGARATGL